MAVYARSITYRGTPALLACDGRCSHAWGRFRPRTYQNPQDPDDYIAASDDEAGPCPLRGMELDAEGGDLKPSDPGDMNKWCARSCERSVVCPIIGTAALIELADWSRPFANKPSPKAQAR